MKGVVSEKARVILSDHQASKELFDYLLSHPKEKPKEIIVNGRTFEVGSGCTPKR